MSSILAENSTDCAQTTPRTHVMSAMHPQARLPLAMPQLVSDIVLRPDAPRRGAVVIAKSVCSRDRHDQESEMVW